jgi:hypothetical protein
LLEESPVALVSSLLLAWGERARLLARLLALGPERLMGRALVAAV